MALMLTAKDANSSVAFLLNLTRQRHRGAYFVPSGLVVSIFENISLLLRRQV